MLVYVEGGKPDNPEKSPQRNARTNNKLNPHMALADRNRIRVTLVGGEHSHHCAIAVPLGPQPSWTAAQFTFRSSWESFDDDDDDDDDDDVNDESNRLVHDDLFLVM